jgi:ubiquinone/menaquinone biosynthesis C-methylase UbiE
MADQHPEIIAHYEVYNEADRLITGNPLEYLRTVEIIKRHLPPPPAVVADIGGGPGVYATWLTQRRYRVHLIDLVARHVETARQADDTGLLSAEIADARQIPMSEGSVDAVLLLGPLYHLVGREDRVKALQEARRILRPGGVLFAAAISRFASAIDGAARDLLADPDFRQIVERDLIDGQHRNPTHDPRYFTTAFFHRPEGLLREVLEAGFIEAEILAVEGFGWTVPDLEGVLGNDPARDRLLAILRRLEAEPALLGASPHLLAVAHRGDQETW